MKKRILHKMGGHGRRPAAPAWRSILFGLAGGFIGVALMAWLAGSQHVPLLIAPFGATCVLLFAAPDSPLAQPRSVIGGHVLSSLCGLLVLACLGNGPLAMGLATGLAIALMQWSRTLHAPAGADPLVILLSGKAGWSFLFMPVLAGSVLLVLLALVLNNAGRDRRWPVYWY